MLLLWLTLSGCVLGVLGVWLAAQPMTASACVVAAAYGICCGILIGAPLSLIHALTRRSKKLVALWGWCRDRLMAIADDRESVVRFHARLIAVMLLASGTALLLRRVSWLLVTIQDEALSADFRLLTGFGVPILALLLALPLVRVLAAALRVIDRRSRLT
ncbi:MAG TPA: hypothetical protein PKA88_36450, partial [Polyangiaceae bacterium]|nr:hypothetical protein [Polyangiaceae bacterium]